MERSPSLGMSAIENDQKSLQAVEASEVRPIKTINFEKDPIISDACYFYLHLQKTNSIKTLNKKKGSGRNEECDSDIIYSAQLHQGKTSNLKGCLFNTQFLVL